MNLFLSRFGSYYLYISTLLAVSGTEATVTCDIYEQVGQNLRPPDEDLPLRETVERSVVDCGRGCGQLEGCTAFTWTLDNGQCVTYDKINTTTESVGKALYIKTQNCQSAEASGGSPVSTQTNSPVTTQTIPPIATQTTEPVATAAAVASTPTTHTACAGPIISTSSCTSGYSPRNVVCAVKIDNSNILIILDDDSVWKCPFSNLIVEGGKLCTSQGQVSTVLSLPATPSAALPIIDSTSSNSRYYFFVGDMVYCYKWQGGMQAVDCNGLSTTSTLTENLFGAGIPSSPDVAMSGSWVNDPVKDYFFLKNDRLYQTFLLDPSPVVEVPSGQIATEVGGSLCEVTAVVTGMNPSDKYVLIRGSYVFDTSGQRSRVCLNVPAA